MKHPMQEMMEKRRQGIKCGIPSYCTANELALEIALRRAKMLNQPVLIEATANQVNQYGGFWLGHRLGLLYSKRTGT